MKRNPEVPRGYTDSEQPREEPRVRYAWVATALRILSRVIGGRGQKRERRERRGSRRR